MLNEKQQKILDYIKTCIKEKGYPPSIREICRAFKFSSPRAGQKYLEALEAAGYIVRESVSRGIKVISDAASSAVTLPFLGYIAAGAPIQVVEEREEIEVPGALVGRRPCYVLQVKGNSMIEDHIVNGDFIVVEQRDTADDGEVVVALVNNEAATLKRLYREKTRVRLEPANSEMEPIYVKDVAVQGIVRGLFRKF
ncbi:MAG: transcriptional repressor LexA [Candidatus Margulisbacteria bacterium]|nr:transcriptional repressor LexA [Candidatus Margulisiibacteriota bacterium]MBU1021025.1 transcriptional repressor LexA [Candidatus Margulisiibacteriota bacterium]MBU1729608.1 transcriptional repressor LexA [Candidatus Margulisiibacteriota bacterium]MBU1956033.1 transcriptional repressor LexA [Candidatus Margulisiibacteriota bacterium]